MSFYGVFVFEFPRVCPCILCALGVSAVDLGSSGFSTTFFARCPANHLLQLTEKTFRPTIAPEVLLASAVGALLYIQGKLFTEGNFDADEEKGKEKEETLSEATSQGPENCLVSATVETFFPF